MKSHFAASLAVALLASITSPASENVADIITLEISARDGCGQYNGRVPYHFIVKPDLPYAEYFTVQDRRGDGRTFAAFALSADYKRTDFPRAKRFEVKGWSALRLKLETKQQRVTFKYCVATRPGG